jgi:hypothetical protein
MSESQRITLIVVGGVVGAIVSVGFAVGVAVLVLHVLVAPTTRMFIKNDTQAYVTIATCGSALTALGPGATATIYPNADDPKEACVVYASDSRDVLGCLYLPPLGKRLEAVVPLSDYVPNVSLRDCVGG